MERRRFARRLRMSVSVPRWCYWTLRQHGAALHMPTSTLAAAVLMAYAMLYEQDSDSGAAALLAVFGPDDEAHSWWQARIDQAEDVDKHLDEDSPF